MNRNLNLIASIGFICGSVFGIAGSIFKDAVMQMCSYEISSVGLIAAGALLTVKFLNEKSEFLAAGFLLPWGKLAHRHLLVQEWLFIYLHF